MQQFGNEHLKGSHDKESNVAKVSWINLLQILHETPTLEDAGHVKVNVANLKDLVQSRWINGEIIDRILEIINDQCPNAFTFNFKNVMDDIAHKLLEKLKNDNRFEMTKKMIFPINIVNVNNPTYLGHTAIDGVYCSGNHFACCIYYSDSNTLYYGDSLGYDIPSDVIRIFKEFLCLFGDNEIASQCLVTSMHCNVYTAGNHVCSNDCWTFFPLQTDSSICGISTIFCMCLAALDDASCMSLLGIPVCENSHYRYLRNVSRYNDFLRLVVAKWLLSGCIDLSVARGEECPALPNYDVPDSHVNKPQSIPERIDSHGSNSIPSSTKPKQEVNKNSKAASSSRSKESSTRKAYNNSNVPVAEPTSKSTLATNRKG